MKWLQAMFEISINTDISVFEFYKYIKKYKRNIDEYFNKNIGETKIIQNS